ncbi:hypothetical protein CSPX01_11443 [Colletotrichum filicis]|nr:hypothetical protein CSPX01_11443 [Colletotrichum filicis]
MMYDEFSYSRPQSAPIQSFHPPSTRPSETFCNKESGPFSITTAPRQRGLGQNGTEKSTGQRKGWATGQIFNVLDCTSGRVVVLFPRAHGRSGGIQAPSGENTFVHSMKRKARKIHQFPPGAYQKISVEQADPRNGAAEPHRRRHTGDGGQGRVSQA